MSNDNSQKTGCQRGVCEVTFRPIQAARRSLQNLKALAADFVDKVKETLSVDSHDAAQRENADQTEEGSQLARTKVETVQERQIGCDTGDNHISRHSADILDRFVQYTGQTNPGEDHVADTGEHLKLVHVRPRAAENQLEPPRYDNPWRYDSHH